MKLLDQTKRYVQVWFFLRRVNQVLKANDQLTTAQRLGFHYRVERGQIVFGEAPVAEKPEGIDWIPFDRSNLAEVERLLLKQGLWTPSESLR